MNIKNISLNIESAFKTRLEKSLEISKYVYIQENFLNIDISENEKFQKIFNGFYKVRRNQDWRYKYYEYFQDIKDKKLSFELIITHLEQSLGRVEPSFSSKMLATINPEMPIWDSKVLNCLGLENAWDSQRTVKNAIDIYNQIVEWYKEYLKTEEAKHNIKVFDMWFPQYTKKISDVKKIDYILWCKG